MINAKANHSPDGLTESKFTEMSILATHGDCKQLTYENSTKTSGHSFYACELETYLIAIGRNRTTHHDERNT